VLVLAGAPIEEPLATYGPFVMNTNEELMAAIADFESGNMGKFPEDE
jgi:redox-sensitive bicupin YhaK (pirin superfamily)